MGSSFSLSKSLKPVERPRGNPNHTSLRVVAGTVNTGNVQKPCTCSHGQHSCASSHHTYQQPHLAQVIQPPPYMTHTVGVAVPGYPAHIQQQPGYGMQQPGYGLQQPGYGMQQPGYGMQQSGYGMHQPGYGMQQPGYGMQQSGYGMQEPGYGMQQPGYDMQQSGYGMQQPGHGVPQPAYGTVQSHPNHGTSQSNAGMHPSNTPAPNLGYAGTSTLESPPSYTEKSEPALLGSKQKESSVTAAPVTAVSPNVETEKEKITMVESQGVDPVVDENVEDSPVEVADASATPNPELQHV